MLISPENTFTEASRMMLDPICGHHGPASLTQIINHHALFLMGLPCGSVVKNLPAKVGVVGSIPGSERSPGEGNGNPLQSSCLGNPMDRGAWQATVHRVSKESDTTEAT